MKVGDRYGRWTVTSEPFKRNGRGHIFVAAVCDCGAEGEPQVRYLERGLSSQCFACGVKARRGRPQRKPLQGGERFGSWLVLERVPGSKVKCRCDCGATGTIVASNLRTGLSMGCAACAALAKRGRTGELSPAFRHGMSKTAEYAALACAIKRCTNPLDLAFHNYGGRGIRVCDEWQGPGGFERFIAHIGPKPSPRHSIDRIDNEGDYRPGNVRWATSVQQARNTRRTKRVFETDVPDSFPTLAEVGARLGISRQAVSQRLASGWTPEEAASIPRGQRAHRSAEAAA